MKKPSRMDALDAVFRKSWVKSYQENGVGFLIIRMRPQYSWAKIAEFLSTSTNVKVRPAAVKAWMVRHGWETEGAKDGE